MNKTELSKDVIIYQQTGKGWENLHSKVSLFIYQWGIKRRSIGEELASDFYLTFLPRMKSLFKNYRDHHCPFEQYLRVCLEWHTIKYHKQRNAKKYKENAYWLSTGNYDTFLAAEAKEQYRSAEGEWDSKRINPSKLNKRRLLSYLLYHVDTFPHKQVERLAEYLDIEREDLEILAERACEKIREKQLKRDRINQRKRYYFIEMRYQEMKLKIVEGREKKEIIEKRISQLRNKMNNLVKRIDRIKMTPTTVDVAELLGESPSTTGRNIKSMREYLQQSAKEEGLGNFFN